MNTLDPDHIFSIYLIQGPDGRGYVGCTSKTPAIRWEGHRAAWQDYGGPGLADAMTRQGRANFTLTHIACARGPDNAAALETATIAQWGTLMPDGYNRAARSNVQRNARQTAPDPATTRCIIKIPRRACKRWPPILDTRDRVEFFNHESRWLQARWRDRAA